MEILQPRSLPVTNKKVIDILSAHKPWQGEILDLGAGEGYFSSLLVKELSQQMSNSYNRHIFACDLFPEQYRFDKII